MHKSVRYWLISRHFKWTKKTIIGDVGKRNKSILCLLGFHKYYEKDGQGYVTDGQCRRRGCFKFK